MYCVYFNGVLRRFRHYFRYITATVHLYRNVYSTPDYTLASKNYALTLSYIHINALIDFYVSSLSHIQQFCSRRL